MIVKRLILVAVSVLTVFLLSGESRIKSYPTFDTMQQHNIEVSDLTAEDDFDLLDRSYMSRTVYLQSFQTLELFAIAGEKSTKSLFRPPILLL